MDTKCIVCGEPWDYWGARHGDMAPWEYELFSKGAGCPCCEGQPNGYTPETIFDVELGDEDCVHRIEAMDADNRPEWKEPPPPPPVILWTCDGCGVEVRKDPQDNELYYHTPPKAPGAKWYHSHNYSRGCPDEEPVATFGKQKVCEFCVTSCDHCGKKVSPTITTEDVYDEGWCTLRKNSEVLCVNCVSTWCEECGAFFDKDGCQCQNEE